MSGQTKRRLGAAFMAAALVLPCVTAMLWADVPYQDPTPQMAEAQAASDEVTDYLIMASGLAAAVLFTAGASLLLVGLRRRKADLTD